MRPLPLEAFERFTRVYDCVDASFEEMRKTASERLRRPGTSIRWHFLLANLVVFVSWFFDSGPRTIVALMNILREPGVYIDGIYMFLQIFGFTVWVFSVARISGAVYRYKDRFPIVLLVYSVFILPIFPVLLSFFLSSGFGMNFRYLSMVHLSWTLISLIFWLLIFVFLFIISGGFPLFVYMILSSISRGKEGDLIPGYIHFVRRAAEKVKDDSAMPVPGSDEWHQIEAIARWKFDGINGRVQTFSFGIASVALFGILALVFTQDDVKRALVWLWEGLMRLLGTRSSGSEGALLLVIAVGVIVLPAVIYFARTYAELRRLEAVGIICALAAGGSAQQHAGPSDAAQPAADGHNETSAAPAAPAVTGDGSPDVPAPSGDLCPDTLPEPNAPAVAGDGSPDVPAPSGDLHSDTLPEPNAPAVSGDGSPDVPAPSGDLHSDTLPEPNAPAASMSGSPETNLSAMSGSPETDLSAGVSAPSATPTPPGAPVDPSNPANPGG